VKSEFLYFKFYAFAYILLPPLSLPKVRLSSGTGISGFHNGRVVYSRGCEPEKQLGGTLLFCGVQLIQNSATLEPRGLDVRKSLLGAKVADGDQMNHIKCDHSGAGDDA
jgi:hypothetical protein